MKPDRLNACLQLVAQTACGFDLTEYLAKAEKQLRGFVVSAGAEEASIFMGTPDIRLAKQVTEAARYGLRADFLERYKPYIEDGETVVASPHKVYGPENNDLILQHRGDWPAPAAITPVKLPAGYVSKEGIEL